MGRRSDPGRGRALDAEVIVIGSGPSGALTAALLAEAGARVLVLEEGPWLRVEDTEPFSAGEMAAKYRHGGASVALGRPGVAYAEARCVGGGSEINSGLYHRTPGEVLRDWSARQGLPDCDEHALAPHFEFVEAALSVGHTAQGASAASRRLEQGAAALGWKAMAVPRWVRTDAQGRDRRESMTRTFVPRLLAAGARLRSSCRVQRLTRSDGCWELECEEGDAAAARPVRLRAADVFLCAGAIQTPALLRRSRLHPAAGASLRMHASAKLTALFDDVVQDTGTGVPVHQVKEFSPRISLGCSISSPAHLHVALAAWPQGHRLVQDHWPRMATYYAMVREGSGSVRTLPGLRDPVVRFDVGRTGLRDLHEGLVRLAQCLQAAGARELYPAASPAPRIETHDSPESIARLLTPCALQLMTIHLMGSCPMAADAQRGVTGPYGAVWGQPRLWVNDSSLLPDAPGVNPQGTVMALARRNVLHYLGQDHA